MGGKFFALLSFVLLVTTGKAQTDSLQNGWQRVEIDSFVSVEIPAQARVKQIKNVNLHAREDSCIYVVQTVKTDGALYAPEFRKSIIDQYIGQGYNLLEEEKFIVQQIEGVRLKFLDDINNLETLKTINYVMAFAIKDRLYTIVFSLPRPHDEAMKTRKDSFFASVKLQNLPVKKSKPQEDIAGSTGNNAGKKNSFFVFYVCGGVMLMLVLVLVLRKRKQKES